MKFAITVTLSEREGFFDAVDMTVSQRLHKQRGGLIDPIIYAGLIIL